MGMYNDGGEFEKIFDEAIRMHTTPSTAWWMSVSLHQFGADLKAMFENHETNFYSDINDSSSRQKEKELLERLVEVSDLQGSC